MITQKICGFSEHEEALSRRFFDGTSRDGDCEVRGKPPLTTTSTPVQISFPVRRVATHRASRGARETANHADPGSSRHGQDAHHSLSSERDIARGSRRVERPRARSQALFGKSRGAQTSRAVRKRRRAQTRHAVARGRFEPARRTPAPPRRPASRAAARGEG